jgi:hypothetical protein
MKTIQRVVPMSRPLQALYDAVIKGDSKALAKYKEFEKKKHYSAEDMELLADTLEFYFSMAPAAATSVDGVRVADRNALRALYKIARAYSGSKGRDAAIPEGMPISSPVEKTVVNTAPLGRLPWQVLGVNEDKATVGIELDRRALVRPDSLTHSRSALVRSFAGVVGRRLDGGQGSGPLEQRKAESGREGRHVPGVRVRP